MKLYTIVFFALFSLALQAQDIIRIDGNFEDWEGIDPIYVDALNDGQNNGIDFERVWIKNDQFNIYIRFELNKEINLQEDNELSLYVDLDNNINSGFKINGIGAELRYFFGERFGIVSSEEGNDFINFFPAAMLISPSISSTEFEIAFSKNIKSSDNLVKAGKTISIRIEDNKFNGDETPSTLGGISYDLDMNNIVGKPNYSFQRHPETDFRILSYNIERDQLFEPGREQYFKRIFQTVKPDIIALQEVIGYSSAQAEQLISSFLPGQWYHKKIGYDGVLLSRYPINYSTYVAGEGAFYLDTGTKEILVINAHLPCCDKDSERQKVVDRIMEYIRDARNGETSYTLQPGTPFFIMGDMNFVGDRNQVHTFTTGDIFDNGAYGDDFTPDWNGQNLLNTNGFATGTYSNFTWINPSGSYFPGKLDWIFYSGSTVKMLNAYNLWTPSITTAELDNLGLVKNDELNASDHLPIVADFSLTTTSIEKNTLKNITLYPNPVIDKIIIETTDDQYDQLKILSGEGQIVMSAVPMNREINSFDVSFLPSGNYYLILTSKTGRLIKKILKL